MDKKIILIGGFHEIIELCEEIGYIIVGIIDNNLKKSFMGYPIIGTDEDAETLYEKYGRLPLVITPDLPYLREKLYVKYLNIGYKFETIISPSAKISKSSLIGVGSIIQHGVNISACVKIGKFVKLNTECNIMHDCIINDFVTIAPNAVVLGRINIGNKTYVGANSTILPDLIIDKNSVIGAGSVVTKNVLGGILVKGVPAK